MIQLSPAVEAEIASAYQGLIFNAYVSLAAAVFPLYDMLLNLDRELEYIWLSRRHWVSRTIYVLNRYMVLPCVSAPILGAFIPFSDSGCIALTWLIDVTATLTLLGSTTFSILRVYALSGRNSLLGGTMLALSLASAVLTTFSFVHIVPTNIPSSSPQLCAFGLRGMSKALYTRLVIASGTLAILSEALATAVNWAATRRTSSPQSAGDTLHRVLWENGNIYLCTQVFMDVIVAISTAFSIHQNIYLGAFGVPIISILNSHFLLALYEADARLRAGTSSSYSIDLRSHGPRRARSPSLPEFAVPFANTIASFDFGAEVEIEEFGSSDAHVVVSEHEYEVGAALVVSRKEDASEELRMA